MRFKCTTCQAEHDLEEVSFGADAPVQWNLLNDAEREESELTDDMCFIWSLEGPSVYIRGCLEIPIQGAKRSFTWGVWCSLSKESAGEILEHWEDPDRETIGPHFGWLCTKIPGYPDTVFLKTMVHQRAPGLRPLVELESTSHPLAVDHISGIEPERLQQMVVALMHEREEP